MKLSENKEVCKFLKRILENIVNGDKSRGVTFKESVWLDKIMLQIQMLSASMYSEMFFKNKDTKEDIVSAEDVRLAVLEDGFNIKDLTQKEDDEFFEDEDVKDDAKSKILSLKPGETYVLKRKDMGMEEVWTKIDEESKYDICLRLYPKENKQILGKPKFFELTRNVARGNVRVFGYPITKKELEHYRAGKPYVFNIAFSDPIGREKLKYFSSLGLIAQEIRTKENVDGKDIVICTHVHVIDETKAINYFKEKNIYYSDKNKFSPEDVVMKLRNAFSHFNYDYVFMDTHWCGVKVNLIDDSFIVFSRSWIEYWNHMQKHNIERKKELLTNRQKSCYERHCKMYKTVGALINYARGEIDLTENEMAISKVTLAILILFNAITPFSELYPRAEYTKSGNAMDAVAGMDDAIARRIKKLDAHQKYFNGTQIYTDNNKLSSWIYVIRHAIVHCEYNFVESKDWWQSEFTFNYSKNNEYVKIKVCDLLNFVMADEFFDYDFDYWMKENKEYQEKQKHQEEKRFSSKKRNKRKR